MPIAPITVPSESRNAEAFSVVGMISPEALRGFRRAFRVTPRAPTSRKRGHELSGLVQADEAGQRLLEHFILAEPRKRVDGVVGLEDLALEVGDEDGVGRILDEALGVGAGLVELAHVPQDADHADDLAAGPPKGGGVEGGGDDFTGGAAGMEADVGGDAALDDLAEGAHQPARLVQADEAGQRLLEDFVLAEPQELGDRLVGDEDLALEVGNEHRVRSIGDDEVSVEILHREDLFRRRPFGPTDPASTARPTRRPSTSSAIPKRPKRPAA